MPFGPYKDFNDCLDTQMSKGKSKGEAQRVCGFIEQRVKGGSNVDVDTIEELVSSSSIDGMPMSKDDFKDVPDCVKHVMDKHSKDLPTATKFCYKLMSVPKKAVIELDDKSKPNEHDDQSKLTKSDFANVSECVTYCVDKLGNTEGQAKIFCTKLFVAGTMQVNPETDLQVNGVPLSKDDFTDINQCKKDLVDTKNRTPQEADAICTKLFSASVTRNEVIQPYTSGTVNPSTDKFFVKAFLIDDTINLNQWGVNLESIPKNINMFIGKPLVLTENFDHPVVDDMSYTHALQYQDIYRIGTIIDITRMDKQAQSPYGNSYYAIIEITNPAAKEAFQSGTLPLYVSPAIAQMTLNEDPKHINDWLPLHLAIVDDPAYTVKKAQITGQCGGDTETCLLRLRQAHIEKFGYGQCGFCVKGKLMSVLTAKIGYVEEAPTGTTPSVTPAMTLGTAASITGTILTSTGTNSTFTATNTGDTVRVIIPVEKITTSISNNANLNTSLDSENQNNVQVTMDNTNPSNSPNQGAAEVPANTPATNAQTQTNIPENTPAQNPSVVEKRTPQPIDLSRSGADEVMLARAENIQFKAENAILKEQKAALEKEVETYKGELNGIKENLRRERIAAIVNNVIEDDKTREETIKFFMESKLAPEQVEAIYQSVGGVKKASVSTTPNYESKMPMTRTAKRNQDAPEHDYEAIYGIGGVVVKNDGGSY